MILTTTNNIENHKIIDYLGIVTGVDINISATKTTFNREKTNKDIEQQILKTKEDAFQKTVLHAKKLGANAIVGILIDVEMKDMARVIVSVTGTAVKVV